MGEAIKKIIQKKSFPLIVLAIIIVLELGWTTYNFIYEKEGCHSDEIWSYGLANSYYQPFIYVKDGYYQISYYNDSFTSDTLPPDYYININTWSTGETYNDYITVQNSEQFSYGSVYHNQTLDNHPPLYYMLLHTVCSFFPDTFSFWFAYALNVVFLIVTQIFLYKLTLSFTSSRVAALSCCGLYGFGLGALSTFIFLRQYSLMTMLGVMYTYFNCAYYKSDFQPKKLIPIMITAFCMFMTLYTSIAYVGIFTACFCIYLLCKRKFKKMFLYGGLTAGSLLLFVVVYPASIKQIFNYNAFEIILMPFYMQFKTFISYITQYNFGFAVSKYHQPYLRIALGVIVCLIIISIPLCFLFRNETWFRSFCKKLLAWFRAFPKKFAALNFIPLFTVCAILALIITLANTTDIILMTDWVMRYIFMTFPLACFLAVVLIYFVFSHIPFVLKAKNILCPILCIAMVITVNVTEECQFFFKHYYADENIDNLFDGKNVLVVLDSDGTWLLTSLTCYLNEADNVFVTTADTIDDYIDELEGSDITFDYCIASQTAITPSDEDTAKISEWSDTDDEESNFIMSGEGDMSVFDEEYTNCDEYVRQLLPDYEVLYGLNLNGGLYCVLS